MEQLHFSGALKRQSASRGVSNGTQGARKGSLRGPQLIRRGLQKRDDFLMRFLTSEGPPKWTPEMARDDLSGQGLSRAAPE